MREGEGMEVINRDILILYLKVKRDSVYTSSRDARVINELLKEIKKFPTIKVKGESE